MAKILIVDDEPRIRELIRENLQYSGYTCEEAGDGSAALSLLSGGGYDLVILDLMMPFTGLAGGVGDHRSPASPSPGPHGTAAPAPRPPALQRYRGRSGA